MISVLSGQNHTSSTVKFLKYSIKNLMTNFLQPSIDQVKTLLIIYISTCCRNCYRNGQFIIAQIVQNFDRLFLFMKKIYQLKKSIISMVSLKKRIIIK